MTNIILDIFCIFLCLMPIAYLVSQQRYRKKLNKYFMWICIANAVMIMGDISDWAIRDAREPELKFTLTALTVIYYISSALVLFFVSIYVIEYLKLSKRQSRILFIAAGILCVVYSVLTFISPITGSVFFVEDDGYHRGNLFIFTQSLPIINSFLCMCCIILNRKKLTRKELFFFSLYLFLPPAAMVVQMLFRGINLVSPIITLNVLIIFINIQYEQELALHRREKELSELQIDIMLSQIQPHFLYNSLATISHLCNHDPEQARQAIKDFSLFLRGNMDSLYNRSPIPFEKEISHVTNYLSLEQRRFQDRLRVIYDIRDTNFLIPPLTLQPIVENAVRHGILHREEGGVITISSEETMYSHRIMISDDGVGIEKSKMLPDTGEHSHIGIDNVRSRLHSMVNGTMEITSGSTGTTVTMHIPKEGI